VGHVVEHVVLGQGRARHHRAAHQHP
jgi:hypothetical protein